MKVILLKDVAKIGKRYEVKEISSGHARNFLIPNGLALLASETNLNKLKSLKSEHDSKLAKSKGEVVAMVKALAGATITIQGKANEQGHLFRGVDSAALSAAVKGEKGLDLPAEWLELERPLKAVGDYEINFAHGEVKGEFKVRIEPLS
ncbi:MAG: 50S ribosomal protein L9 [Patescibacteria group bacterium]